MVLITYVEEHIHKLSCLTNLESLYNVKYEVPVTCVSSAIAKAIGRVNAMHEL